MNWYRDGIVRAICSFICLGGISLAIPGSLAIKNDNSNSPQYIAHRASTRLSKQQLQLLSQAITVKIFASDSELIGSGTLLKREGQVYTVITNAHVKRSANPPYKVQTASGQVYQASVLPATEFKDNDLAVLQFNSSNVIYKVATVRDMSALKVGDEVFVGGFISNGRSEKVSHPAEQDKNNFVFTDGKISLLLGKALKGGYQIGYTNDVRRGMSGAPLLNVYGEVVGINSLRQDPLWDTEEVYQDGSEPSSDLRAIIARSSMAVPICPSPLQNHREKKL